MRISILLALSLISSAFATVVGLSTHPFEADKKVITTEFDSYFSNGSGMGITAKYYQKLNNRVNVDAGVGITSGDRENRVFVGADYELFPDYGRQPRVSVKGILETLSFNDERINSFGIAPTVSKGVSLWGREAFPFVALPVSVSLNTEENTYETATALSTGITRRFRMEGARDLVANLEANFDLRNSFTALVLGVSLPLQ